jgi:Fe-S cluster assembly ATP-binding protein
MAMLVVSHYERFYQLIKPEYTHVLVNGKIVLEGDAQLADKIDKEGYDWIYKEYHVQPAAAEEVKKVTASIGTCAVRQAATAEAKK